MNRSKTLDQLIKDQTECIVPCKGATYREVKLASYDSFVYVFRTETGNDLIIDRNSLQGAIQACNNGVEELIQEPGETSDETSDIRYDNQTSSLFYNERRFTWYGSSSAILGALFDSGIGNLVPFSMFNDLFSCADERSEMRYRGAISDLREAFDRKGIPLTITCIRRKGYILERKRQNQ